MRISHGAEQWCPAKKRSLHLGGVLFNCYAIMLGTCTMSNENNEAQRWTVAWTDAGMGVAIVL